MRNILVLLPSVVALLIIVSILGISLVQRAPTPLEVCMANTGCNALLRSMPH